MASKPQYILDANVFIEAHRNYYAFDLCPGFWQSIEHYGAQGAVTSIDKVRDELKEGDPLDQWKESVSNSLFLPSDTDDDIAAYREIILWVERESRFKSAAKANFANGVDAWLIACAKARGLKMVTHEAPAPNSKTSVKIPDVCKAFDITYCNTFDMLRELRISYNWTASDNDE